MLGKYDLNAYIRPMPLTLTYTVGFSSNEAKTIGSIRVTDTTDWVGQGVNPADVEIGIGITAPDGHPYRLDTVPQTGNIHPAIQDWMEFPLPTDVAGLIQTGDYIVSFHAVSAVGPIDQTDTSTHNLCTDFPALCLTPTVDCLRLVVSITDATGWEAAGWTVNSRSMILQYPSVTYHANITGSGPTISTSGEPIWAGTWTGTVTVSVTKDNYTVSITTVKQFDVSCNFDGCRLLCLLEAKYAEYTKAKARGDSRLAGDYLKDFQEMAALSQTIQMSIGCGDDTLLNTLISQFKIIATGSDSDNCDCCDNCSEPRELVPIWGGGGTMWTPIAGSNITITAGVNTYTFAVSAAFANLVASLYNTEVISSDGSLDITSSTVGITKTFDALVRVPAPDTMTWTETWTPLTNARAASTPVLNPATGNVFKDTFVGSATGIFNTQWQVSNFFSGATVDYDIDIKITNVIAASGYGATVGTNGIGSIIAIDNPQHNATTFTFSLVLAADALGGVIGTRKKLDDVFWQRYIDSFQLEYKLTRK